VRDVGGAAAADVDVRVGLDPWVAGDGASAVWSARVLAEGAWRERGGEEGEGGRT